MLCVTSNDIPGWEIQRVCGEVFGVTVRSRNAFSQIGAGFKSMVGGELQGMTRQVMESRNEAMNRLFAEAQTRGGNAIVTMRFDTTELGGNWSEICAYGTAVVAVPVTDEAKQTAMQLGYGRPGSGGPGGAPAAGPGGAPGSAPAGGPGGYAGPSGGPGGGPGGYGQPAQSGQPGGHPGQPGGHPGQPSGQPGQPGGHPGQSPSNPGGQPQSNPGWGNTQYSSPYPPARPDGERS